MAKSPVIYRMKSNGHNVLDWLSFLVVGGVVFLAVFTLGKGVLNTFSSHGATGHDSPAVTAQALALKNDPTYQGWYNGASGYEEAMKLHLQTKKPLLVYFYAPWCGYCAKFHRTILSSPEGIAGLKDYIKVRSYAGDGQAEEQMMGEFGATGYPSVYVKSVNVPVFKQVSMYTPDGELMLTTAFLEKLKKMSQ